MERTEPGAAGRGATPPADDAIGLLTGDHARATALFERVESAPEAERTALVQRLCEELEVHAALEEEIFYPAVRGPVDADLVDEALAEHATAKRMIADLEAAGAHRDDVLDRVRELREAIEHHVDEEEGEMFPQVRSAGIDLAALGERIAERRRELVARGI